MVHPMGLANWQRGWGKGGFGGTKGLPRSCPRCDPASRDAFRGHLDPQDTGAGASRRVTAAQRSSTRRKRRRWRKKRRMGGFGCVSSAAFAIPKPGEPGEPFTRSIFSLFFSPSPPLFPPRARMKCGVTRGRAPLT